MPGKKFWFFSDCVTDKKYKSLTPIITVLLFNSYFLLKLWKLALPLAKLSKTWKKCFDSACKNLQDNKPYSKHHSHELLKSLSGNNLALRQDLQKMTRRCLGLLLLEQFLSINNYRLKHYSHDCLFFKRTLKLPCHGQDFQKP